MATTKTKKQTDSKLDVLKLDGSVLKTIDLPTEIFNAEVSSSTISQYVRVYQQNMRQGTVSTKTRSEVTGSTRKIYRQKGTGGARHGARKAPIFVGGGITFGPKPRTFDLKINKKQRKVALFSCLTLKNQDGDIYALAADTVDMDPKTKSIASFMKKQNLSDKKTLIITAKPEKGNLHLASRNISNITVVDAQSINAYNVLSNEAVVIMEDAVEQLQTHFIGQA
jgi:large subunit ribosomal protein L4